MIVGGDVFSGGKKQMDCSSGKKNNLPLVILKKFCYYTNMRKQWGKIA